MEVTRVFELLPRAHHAYGKDDLLAYKADGQWRRYSSAEVIETVEDLSVGMMAQGVKAGDRVGIVSMNRPEWNFVDLALQHLGAISVPVYPTLTDEDTRYIFQDAGVSMVFVSTDELYQKMQGVVAGSPTADALYTFDVLPGAMHWSALKKSGSEAEKAAVKAAGQSILPDDLLTLIYTSGTTGRPKGVMLTHRNLLSNVEGSVPRVPVGPDHRALSFLPLCHVFERMIFYLYLRVGVSVYYAESLDTISENLKEIKPHLFTTVPRLLEKVYDRIVTTGYGLQGVKKKLFFWALNLGLRYEPHLQFGWFYRQQLALANRIIFSKWREALGGNIVCIVSGGAALQPRLGRVFWAAQMPVLEGYGLTETSPVIGVNQIGATYVGTVGQVLNNVEVKLADDGEILVKGPSVMKGYFQQPEKTAEVFDADGWFRTGDIGTWIDGKYLKITDRKKEIFKTSGAKYIAPQPVENKLKESLVIEQVMVVGEGEKFPAALIVPSPTGLRDWCQLRQIAYTTDEEMTRRPEIIEKFQREIDALNEGLAQYERIKKFYLVPHVWSIEGGELTPTLKLKRRFIHQKYQTQIDALYR